LLAKIREMLYQLRNLSDSEKQVMLDGPIWAGLLVGIADGHLDPEEAERIASVIKTKTYSEKNDVHFLYQDLAEDHLNEHIDTLAKELSSAFSTEEKVALATAKLARLNKPLTKLESGYAKQYTKSLRSISLAVAKVSGGIFGIGRITEDEKGMLNLPMIEM
jgi:uncharacterized membrane protein YebE (DUF533 family)